MPRWRTARACARWHKHETPALAGFLRGSTDSPWGEWGAWRRKAGAQKGTSSQSWPERSRAGPTTSPPDLTPLCRLAYPPSPCTVLRTLQKEEKAGLPSPCDCLHGVGPAARSRSTSYAGVRPDGLVARSHRARIKSCFGHTAFADCLERITFDNLSPNFHESSRRQRNIF